MKIEDTPTPGQQTQLSPENLSALEFVEQHVKAYEAKNAGKPDNVVPDPKAEVKPAAKPAEVKPAAEAKPAEVKPAEVKPDAVVPTDDVDDELSPFEKAVLGVTADGTSKGDATDTTDTTGADDDDNIELPERASAAAKESFAKLKAGRAQLKQELAAAKAEKAELEKKIADGGQSEAKIAQMEAEMLELKTRNETVETRLYALDVKSSRAYNNAVTKPLETLSEKAATYAKKYGVDPKKLSVAIAQRDTQPLADLLGELGANSFDHAEIAKLRTDVHSLLDMRETLEADAKEAARILKEGEAQHMSKVIQQRDSLIKQSTAQQVDVVKKSMPILFSKIEGDADWNKGIEDFDTFIATVDPTQFTEEQAGQSLAMAAAAPRLAMAYNRLLAEHLTLRSKYSRATKAAPKAGPSKPGSTAAGGSLLDVPIEDFVTNFVKNR